MPSLLLLATPDDYLLELARGDHEAEWKRLHPEGEIVAFDEAPAAARLIGELTSPSLFAPERLLVVRDAAPYFEPAGRAAAAIMAEELARLSLRDTSLVLALQGPEPHGPLAEVARTRGELRYLPLPPEPKPWDKVAITDEQRAVLRDLIARVAPDVAAARDAVEALCEAYGFQPRELAQAAQRLALTGELTAEAVWRLAGLGELSLAVLEDALVARSVPAYLRFASALSAGAVLVNWRGEALAPEACGPVLVGMLGRLLRHALAMRGYARRAGIAEEFVPARCAQSHWYNAVFKRKLHKPLAEVITPRAESPFGKASAWQLHHAFRLAAAYDEKELLAAIANLARSGAERTAPEMALAAISAVVLKLLAPSASTPTRRAAAG